MTSSFFSITRWRPILAALSFAGTLFAAETRPAPEKNGAGNYNIPLWDENKVPLAKGNEPLDNPFLTVSLPPAGKRNGGSVVVAPGGGNIMLLYGLEGLDIAFEYLDKAYLDHDPILLTLKYMPWVPAALKEDPRFQIFLDHNASNCK